MKNTIKRAMKRPITIYIFLMLTYIPFWIVAQKGSGDDISMFRGVLNHQNIIEYTIQRYFSWSSRNMLEVFTVLFCNYVPFVLWKIVNLAFYLLLFTTLWSLFFDKQLELGWLLALGLQFVPVKLFNETGMITIATTYIWPLTFGFLSLFPLKWYLCDKRIKWWQFVFSYCFFAIAGNMELYLTAMIPGYIIYLVVCRKCNKRYTVPILGYGMILVLETLSFIYCPGNKLRAVFERSHALLYHSSLWHKLYRGFTSTMLYCIGNYEFQFFVFSLVLIYLLIFYKRVSCLWEKAVLLFVPVFSFLLSYIIYPVEIIGHIPKSLSFLFITEWNTKRIYQLVCCIAILLLWVLVVVYMIYFPIKYRADIKLYDNTDKTIILPDQMILCFIIIGLLSCYAMGLSPTIDIDLTRQSILCHFGVLLASLYLLRYYTDKSQNAKQIYVLCALLSWGRNIVMTFYYF